MSDTPDSPVYGAVGAPDQTPKGDGPQGLTRVTRLHHLAELKATGEPWPMLTAYDFVSARLFQEAGIPVLLVGDSAANVVYGYDTTVPVTEDEMIPLVRAVTRGAPKALVVADLVFGSYEASPTQAVAAATRMMKEGGAQAVKLEGGVRMVPQIKAIVDAGIPVMAHIGFTPQSVNGLGGFRVQGRGDAADQLRADARAVQEAGAFSVVMEMVPADLAREVTAELEISTVGIGAGNGCDAQVLVWQDMAGHSTGRTAKFVKRYAELADTLRDAAREYGTEVRSRAFPGAEHSF
ncbi:3-methyl-2-oxobutanoate hydroxymethyltransferase [Dietzia maris]|jgi:3-methyl-2-oxobutanoate hydroxymethyltransferase|uniref:3-methyl-2-oxobutanoate hydroxymethyltransferase n=1 Tax=Dietzia TaxID=37914 RepID=UPI001330D179|nr:MULTISPECIES: 3-methyl-2-oxobutanoate hydroxymethyltransferase [Dietzia]MBB0991291.1 3-methyl-2-oxobutanoate hydroxymethyltransferase [Dietzia sp. SLG510A3-30A2]MBB0994377.1 3-methyl-2-oxobutanoate hydroxymethyltransferase [Dietzia sp. SLG510A3-40A3]MBB1009718.1 3-methyl-2-oxobutanoate hydroxymethyltransferase [Dietzia sp. SLG510A3-3B2-2]MBB0997770.1 3-methyl-2-oxobutanoate hydroxymethyltransferase [Dietzia maris]MCZ4541173.1 3-methyl-2-oxobutanoate hydroxymethyltransferase [Dietzia maris]